MRKKILKNSIICLALASYASFGIFYSANSIEEVNKTIFSVNYNDPSYDSKYILSPYSGETLSTTTGSNYYIFVHETYYLITHDDDPDFQDMTTRPNAFVCPNSYYSQNYFTFNYTAVHNGGEADTLDKLFLLLCKKMIMSLQTN